MKIAIRTHAVTLTPTLRDQIQDRLGAAFARVVPAVRAADVTLADVNGPRGGIDKECRLRIHSDGLAPVVVRSAAAELGAAIADAAERAGRALRRAQVRRRSFAPAL